MQAQKTGSFQSFSPSLPCTPFAALQVWSPIKAFTGAIVAASLSVKDVRTSQEDCGEGCAGEFRCLVAFELGEMDSEHLRNRYSNLQLVPGTVADQHRHRKSA